MNASSPASAGGGEDGRKASPIRIGETNRSSSFETAGQRMAPMIGGKTETLSQNSPDKSAAKTTSDGPSKENGAKQSLSRQTIAEGIATQTGSKRKEQQHDSLASTQSKKPRVASAEVPNETHVPAIDDAQTESEDEYSSAGEQKSPEALDPNLEHPQKPPANKAEDGKDDSLQAKVTASSKEQRETDARLESEGPLDAKAVQIEGIQSRRVPFPVTLYQVLENDDYKDACCWLTDGLGFALDPEIFTRKVVDVYFRGSKFSSCKRKLNRWGFRRVTMDSEAPGTMTYYHPLFRRGFPELIKQMNGGRLVANKKRPAQAPPDERGGDLTRPASQWPTAGQSSDQQALLAAMLGGVFNSMSGSIGSLMGGETMGGGLSSLMTGGSMQIPGGGMPFAAPPQQMSSDAEAMNQILLEQERLRLGLARKDQDKLELRQKLDEEMLRRKAQEDHLREMVLAPAPNSALSNAAGYSQGFPPQMLPTGFGSTTSMPTGIFPGMPSQPLMGQTAGLSQFSQQQGQGWTQFPQGPGWSQQPEMMPSDGSAPLVTPAPAAACSATNEVDLARLRNMSEQEEKDFQRRVQEELALRLN